MGSTFPAVNVGAMGSVSGQELGLGSGIVNMSRQVGFALGVAMLVAVFSGTIDDNVRDARVEIVQVAQRADFDQRQTASLLGRSLSDPTQEGAAGSPAARNAVEREAQEIAHEAARDSFASGFHVASLTVLLAIPFALLMRRRPAEVHSAAAAEAAVA